MVNIHRRGKDPFLKSDYVKDGDLATIVGKPYIQSAEDSTYGKERTIITVKLKRTDGIYRWGLNTTSSDRLVDKYGEDADSWEGKQVKIRKVLDMVRGEEKDVLYAIPSVQEALGPAEKPLGEHASATS